MSLRSLGLLLCMVYLAIGCSGSSSKPEGKAASSAKPSGATKQIGISILTTANPFLLRSPIR